jgi:hypothetical protein
MAWDDGDRAMASYVASLTAARRNHPVLRYGEVEPLASPDGVLACRRSYGKYEAVVLVNISDTPFSYSAGGEWTDPLTEEIFSGTLSAAPCEGRVFVSREIS